ncbi:DsbA family protein [Albidovulum sp.]|uniref:DsbA family protein n=1 Tax=Albidovulum sp. TaxID=1872424 RepID=UPI001DCC8BF4|nr:DsbA family protein [Paracoccaceae bacterium]MCC0045440.1 DsbA family protein [Defluviimonas sp.]HPE26789.1 DsbA family protein [Albidovulum sp.]MCB2120179.1 DsbA family protein [Paracoccaceae bacterium]MCB2123570.1 DsbA family protein [Paracoccaceae bacterium]
MSKKLKLAVVLATGVVGGALWSSQQGATLPPALSTAAEAQTATASSEAALVPDMVQGQEDAPVTVVEYASFTCPHCQHFHEEVYGQLKSNYIDTGKIKFVYREVYFDKFGLWAAMVARCGGAEKYFGISDMIYDTQKEWLAAENEAGIAENLRKIGLKAGIAPDALDACLKDNDMAKAMVANYQTKATADDITGTPSFIIDGQKYSNMSYEDFAKVLDEKLAK